MKSTKRMMVVLVMMAVFMMLIAAASAVRVQFESDDTFTVDSQYSAEMQELSDLIIVVPDSAIVVLAVSGVALLDPGDKLYIGLGNDSANQVSASDLSVNSNLDTAQVAFLHPSNRGRQRVSFYYEYVHTVVGSGTTDTFFFNVGSGGQGSREKIYLEDVISRATQVQM
ncbi:MAG TPA: hypothetical protein VFI02_14070 [Armatimonadota bacterium]|nr:hypothetical protein [Armatimonadota bacterium]